MGWTPIDLSKKKLHACLHKRKWVIIKRKWFPIYLSRRRWAIQLYWKSYVSYLLVQKEWATYLSERIVLLQYLERGLLVYPFGKEIERLTYLSNMRWPPICLSERKWASYLPRKPT